VSELKVIAALAALGGGIYLVAPGVADAAVPLLVLAVCPLSMLLMMRAMSSVGRPTQAEADEVAQLRAEIAELRQTESGAPSDERAGRG
jgi:pyruvate/2-oxoacid:ferredoxin oxidoreductase alpha subunit